MTIVNTGKNKYSTVGQKYRLSVENLYVILHKMIKYSCQYEIRFKGGNVMQDLRANLKMMESKKNALKRYYDKLKKEIETFNSIADKLPTYWEGDASTEFKSKYEKEKNALIKYRDAVEKYYTVLNKIIEDYKNVEIRNKNLLSDNH